MRPRRTALPVIAAYDIETTNYIDNGEKRSIVYNYRLQVEDSAINYRTREQFLSALSLIAEKLGASDMTPLVVWVHKLPFEWQFLKHYLEWDPESVFANGSEHNVIRARSTEGIEFRCSLALTNKSLAEVGKDVGVPKMEGDLDYSLMRHSETPLTEEELGYIAADTAILIALIRQKLAEGDTLDSLPMTKTGFVRRAVRKAVTKDLGYKKLMKKLVLTPETYEMSRTVYQGGYTHANAEVTGQVLRGVVGYDIASSYPASLLAFTYPVSPFREVKPSTAEEFHAMLGACSAILDVTLEGVSSRYPFPTISQSRTIELVDEVLDNGRVWSASKVRVMVTDVDYELMLRCYDADHLTLNGMWVADSAHLPTPLVQPIMEMYKDKTVLKGVEGEEVAYRVAKENLNSLYGMIGTDPVRVSFEMSEDVLLEAVDKSITESLDEYNTSRNRFLYYPWGAWCTAYSRAMLLATIYDLCDAGVTVAYCDTDSIYAVDSPEVAGVFEAANARMMKRLDTAVSTHSWRAGGPSVTYEPPLDSKGSPRPIGVFERETPVPLDEFKTLGAKRYAKVDRGKFTITVAGLAKRAAAYVEEMGGMDFFRDGMTIPPEHSGRLTHAYFEHEITNLMEDHTGRIAPVTQKGYIHLEATEYRLGLSDEYREFVLAMETGSYR